MNRTDAEPHHRTERARLTSPRLPGARLLCALAALSVANCSNSDPPPPPPAPSAEAGSQVHASACGQCHALRPPSRHTATEWTALVGQHRERVTLSAGQWADLRAFLEAGANGR